MCTPLRRGPAVKGEVDVGAGHGDHAISFCVERGTGVRDFQSRGVLRVADEQVADAEREVVERAGGRHADVIPVPPAQVLDGRQQAGLDDVQHVAASSCRRFR